MSFILDAIKTVFGTVFSTALSDSQVAVILDSRAQASSERLAWRTSVVDLMKLTGMDSSLSNREKLALQYGWSGKAVGSAEMNQFLHDKLLQQLRWTLR